RVELEQKVAALGRLPGLDMNRRNVSGIERLDHLGIAWRLDLAWSDGVDVEPTEVRPGQCGEGEGAGRRHQCDRSGRRRRLENFQRGGQKLAIAASDVNWPGRRN